MQAQFALRLQQQSEEKKVKAEPAPPRPLDFNNKTPPNLMSFASLMMDSWSSNSFSSASPTSLTALQKISHLAQRSLAIPTVSNTDRFPSVNQPPSPFPILQMPYGGLKSNSPHWPPLPAPAAPPRSVIPLP